MARPTEARRGLRRRGEGGGEYFKLIGTDLIQRSRMLLDRLTRQTLTEHNGRWGAENRSHRRTGLNLVQGRFPVRHPEKWLHFSKENAAVARGEIRPASRFCYTRCCHTYSSPVVRFDLVGWPATACFPQCPVHAGPRCARGTAARLLCGTGNVQNSSLAASSLTRKPKDQPALPCLAAQRVRMYHGIVIASS